MHFIAFSEAKKLGRQVVDCRKKRNLLIGHVLIRAFMRLLKREPDRWIFETSRSCYVHLTINSSFQPTFNSELSIPILQCSASICELPRPWLISFFVRLRAYHLIYRRERQRQNHCSLPSPFLSLRLTLPTRSTVGLSLATQNQLLVDPQPFLEGKKV